MPSLTQRLLYAARQTYQIANDGTVGDAPNSGDIGWTTPPTGFVSGPDDIDAGFVGETAGEIIIAFRGTLPPDSPDQVQTLTDWLNDFDALLVADPNGLGGKVHQGFQGARDLVWGDMMPLVATHATNSPAKPICVTGHSKGGAVANLAAGRLHKERPASQIYVCTFAAARPGDPQFADLYNATIAHSDRYEYQDDIVPHVPPSDAFAALVKQVPLVDNILGHFNAGFASVGRLYFINWDNKIVPESALLHLQRFTHLAELLGALDVKTIANDHSIDPGSGYADAPYS